MQAFRIAQVSHLHRRQPIDHVIKTAFGTMRERHAVFVRIEDDAGHCGLGETWVNFPTWGAFERVAALEHGFAPWLQDRTVEDIPGFIQDCFHAFLGPARQSGTIPTLVSALCGIELALWDIAAQAAGLPLARLLFAQPAERVRVYASGINSPLPLDLVDAHLDCGVTLFKLKVAFGEEEDRANLTALSRHLGERAAIAVDANRGWDYDTARRWLPILADHGVQWLEEPLIPADEHRTEELRAASPLPLSGGENILSLPGDGGKDLLTAPYDIIQPDLTKYHPLHVMQDLLAAAPTVKQRLIPHFLGSAPGQAASLHFAAGCPEALVEMDINRNPLRTDFYREPFTIEDGHIALPDRPGLGWTI